MNGHLHDHSVGSFADISQIYVSRAHFECLSPYHFYVGVDTWSTCGLRHFHAYVAKQPPAPKITRKLTRKVESGRRKAERELVLVVNAATQLLLVAGCCCCLRVCSLPVSVVNKFFAKNCYVAYFWKIWFYSNAMK